MTATLSQIVIKNRPPGATITVVDFAHRAVPQSDAEPGSAALPGQAGPGSAAQPGRLAPPAPPQRA